MPLSLTLKYMFSNYATDFNPFLHTKYQCINFNDEKMRLMSVHCF